MSHNPASDDPDRITNPRRLRALAHPVRLQILESLRADGATTVSALSGRLNISVASLSYHLHQLASHQFVEIDPALARDRREKWWRARPAAASWSSADFLETPARKASAGALRSAVLSQHSDLLRAYLGQADAQEWDTDWVDAAVILDDILKLTPAEVKQMQRELMTVLSQRKEVVPPTGGDPSRESVVVVLYAFPRRRPS